MEKSDKLLKYWLPVIFWAGVIFYLSSLPGLSSGLAVFWDVLWRKFAHAGEFTIFNWLLWRALRAHDLKFGQALILSLAATVLYAVSDEVHQYFVPDRQCRLLDVGIDSLGAIFGSATLLLLKIKRQNKN
jgi:VanZ family protein